MRLVSVARRPVTVFVIVLSVLAARGAIFRMKADIFPKLGRRRRLCGAAVRRNGSLSNGGLSPLLRVPLPLSAGIDTSNRKISRHA
jgi:hypothetical protein